MAEAEVERPDVVIDATTTPVASPTRGRPRWVGVVAGLVIFPLIGFIAWTGRSLWVEWKSLQQDQVEERDSAVVGYLNITPNPSHASRPADWFRIDGDDAMLWAGWKDGENHWFRFARGDLDGRGLSMPLGRDAIQAIDLPVFEQSGGLRWGRVPPEALVVGFEEGGTAHAYPIRVLDKVQVVNDQLGGRPILITYRPEVEGVSIFEGSIDGRRVNLGHGGYFREAHPVLYDRATQSLWSESDGAMVAVAGARKGARLKQIAKVGIVAWSDWKGQHPDGRLLVGADRSRGLPVD